MWSKRLPPLPGDHPWVVFVSPPWSFFAERWDDLAALVEAVMQKAPAGSTVVVEADTTFDRGLLPDPAAWETREIPPAVLHFWHRG